MEALTVIIKYLTYTAVLFTLMEFYLKVNKIWKRRAEPEVAASQSLIALAIGGFTSMIWLANYIISQDWESVGEYSIFLAETFVMMLIGTGLFVRYSKTKQINLWKLIKESIKTEKEEAAYLYNTLIKPSNSDLILKILYKIALIDGTYDPTEKKMLDKFAAEWELDITELCKDDTNDDCRYMKIKESFAEYLNLYPPKEQVRQLKDLIYAIVQADETIAKEEQMIIDEVVPMIQNYISNESESSEYLVIVVPQNEEQMAKTSCFNTNAEKIHSAGGIAYAMESFNSKMFAELMCDKYRSHGYFTTVLDYKAKTKSENK